MSNKLLESEKGDYLCFYCPGCRQYHCFTVKGEKAWQWNGSKTAPTFSPSLLCNGSDPARRCHLFVENGQIRYLSDCWHDLKGQTIPMQVED